MPAHSFPLHLKTHLLSRYVCIYELREHTPKHHQFVYAVNSLCDNVSLLHFKLVGKVKECSKVSKVRISAAFRSETALTCLLLYVYVYVPLWYVPLWYVPLWYVPLWYTGSIPSSCPQVLQEMEGGGAATGPPTGLQSRRGPAATGLGGRAGTRRPETQVPRADPRLCSGPHPPSTCGRVRCEGGQELPRGEPGIRQL